VGRAREEIGEVARAKAWEGGGGKGEGIEKVTAIV
jgi:hypothetical protein